MNKIERLEAAIAGKEVDRVPYSIWYHLSAVDQDPVSLAEETVALSKKYDYDFVKMMPFGLYGVQDLGAKINIFAQQGKPPWWLVLAFNPSVTIWRCSPFLLFRAPMASSWSLRSFCTGSYPVIRPISRPSSVP